MLLTFSLKTKKRIFSDEIVNFEDLQKYCHETDESVLVIDSEKNISVAVVNQHHISYFAESLARLSLVLNKSNTEIFTCHR